MMRVSEALDWARITYERRNKEEECEPGRARNLTREDAESRNYSRPLKRVMLAAKLPR